MSSPSFGSSLFQLLRGDPKFSLPTLLFLSILLLSSFHTPDPTSSSFQWPGLLPSKYPETKHIGDPYLNARLEAASQLLSSVCKEPLEPIYVDPGLTPSQEVRYNHLRRPSLTPIVQSPGKILIVSTLRQIHDQLPDLLNAFIVLVTYLGPSRLVFSIVEGPSDDCTTQAFYTAIGPTLLRMGVPANQIHFVLGAEKIDWDSHNRIQVLADLRNRALSPLWTPSTLSGSAGDSNSVGTEYGAIVMLNDVFLKAGDILELLHQHVVSGAGITTAWDWWKRSPAYYYDVWVGRTIDTGDLFYPINGDSWSPSDEIFYNSPASKAAYDKLQPLQAYSAWNGLVVMDPKPFLAPHKIRFGKGDATKGECTASECSLIAQDYWARGFGRIQVVPSVQLAYDRPTALETKEKLLETQESLGWIDGVPPTEQDQPMQWITSPPNRVRCHPWPEVNGLGPNVWEKTVWVDPLTGLPKQR